MKSTVFQGQRVWIVLADSPGTEVGNVGEYHLTFTLSRFDLSRDPDPILNFDPEMQGDSFVRIVEGQAEPSPTLDLRIGGKNLRLRLDSNDVGRLHRIVIEALGAASFEDAERIGFQAVASTLATWSAELDLPFQIARVLVIEHRTGFRRVTWTAPFPESPLLSAKQRDCSTDFRVYAGLYREGLASNSAVYQFLCFFKIVEGLFARRARESSLRALRGEKVVRRPREIVPSDPIAQMKWLRSLFPVRRDWDELTLAQVFWPEAHGQKFTTIRDKILRPLRNEIAHVLEADGEPSLLLDHLPHVNKIDRWLPLTRCIARQMMKAEFPDDYLGYMNDKGNVIEGDVVILGAKQGDVTDAAPD